jgi:hypothetical protein
MANLESLVESLRAHRNWEIQRFIQCDQRAKTLDFLNAHIRRCHRDFLTMARQARAFSR